MIRTGLIFMFLVFITCNSQVYSQKHNKRVILKGTVTDLNKKPVMGAVILLDNKQTGKVTDRKGLFKIKISPSVKSIMACTPSDGTGRVEYNGQSELTIIIDKKTPLPDGIRFESRDDDQINIGYGTTKRKDLTTSASTIDTRKNKYSGYTDIYQLIKGEFPGVQVSGHSIKIRGVNSLMSGTDPLFVVNGIAVNSIDYIIPIEVRSISVLKGAEAAIYGSRGANGVIMIELIK
jgi:TonB-dependent SusC/RagA subfamily outer membrane receptor